MSRGCTAMGDSKKPFTTAVLKMTYSANDTYSSTRSFNDPDIPESTFTGTFVVDEQEKTRTWTRAVYKPQRDSGGLPADGSFWVLAPCCCANCRWQIGLNRGELADTFFSDETFAFDLTETSKSGTDPVETVTGTTLGTASARILLGDTRDTFCHKSAEAGRKGQIASLGALTAIFTNVPDLNWTYSDSDGKTDMGGPVTQGDLDNDGLTIPMSGGADFDGVVHFDSCAANVSVWAKIDFDGTDTNTTTVPDTPGSHDGYHTTVSRVSHRSLKVQLDLS